MTETKQIIIGLVVCAIMALTLSLGTFWWSAQSWTQCGATEGQAIGLEWKYGDPNGLSCLLVHMNTANN